MEETRTDEPCSALQAGTDATLKHLEDSFKHDFNLKHPRLAYIVGANKYLEKMEEANLQDEISRDDFENALHSVLPSVETACAIRIKYDFLLSSLSDNINLYNTYWAEQYEARSLTNPSPEATQAFFCLEATLFETRSALARYRAGLRVAEPGLVEEVDACIKQYNNGLFKGEVAVVKGDEQDVGIDERVWATDDDEGDEEDVVPGAKVDPIAAANANDDPRKRRWGRIIEVGDTWERRADGWWYCTECFGRGYPGWNSMKRHLHLKHQLLV